MASVGNGHLATTVLTDTIFLNGVYSGRLGTVVAHSEASFFLGTTFHFQGIATGPGSSHCMLQSSRWMIAA